MQKEMNVSDESLDQELPDEELIDTLIAISVVSKRLAHKLRVIKEKGEQEDGSHEKLIQYGISEEYIFNNENLENCIEEIKQFIVKNIQ